VHVTYSVAVIPREGGTTVPRLSTIAANKPEVECVDF